MIHIDKPSLSVCAFGAGAAHAAVLALILPVMVTLPAPEDQAQGTVAIQVAVRSIPPASLVAAAAAAPDMLEGALAGEGDVDDTAWNELPPQELTGALPDIPEQAPLNEAPAAFMEQAALSDPVAAKPPVESADPVMNPDAALMERALESEAEMELRAVARVEATEPAAFSESEAVSVTVPLPLRKPAMRAVIRETVEVRPAPAPRRQVPARRTTTRAAPKPVFKGFFGGRPATPMKEFPFPAGR